MGKHPIWEAIEAVEFVPDLEKLVTPGEKEKTAFLAYKMLYPYREVVIKKFKEPLRKGIVLLGEGKFLSRVRAFWYIWQAYRGMKGLPELTRGGVGHNANVLWDMKDNLLECLKVKKRDSWIYGIGRERVRMLEVVFNVLIYIVGHDMQYYDILQVLAEWFAEEYNSGNWWRRWEGHPLPKYWTEGGI